MLPSHARSSPADTSRPSDRDLKQLQTVSTLRTIDRAPLAIRPIISPLEETRADPWLSLDRSTFRSSYLGRDVPGN